MDKIKSVLSHHVSDVKISAQLVKSPCAVVAPEQGYSGTMERVIQAQIQHGNSAMAKSQYATHQKTIFEINPVYF